MEARTTLIALSLKCGGDWERIRESLGERIVPEDEWTEKAEKAAGNAITIIDPDYPEALKQCFKPPFVIYFEGDKSLLSSNKIVSVAGKKDPSAEEFSFAKETCGSLAGSGCPIAFGMSQGISEAAEKATSDLGMGIRVLGCGIGMAGSMHPKKRMPKAALSVSEYPDGCLPSPDKAHAKDRIVAALGKVMAVFGISHDGSSAMRMASMALSMCKEIACAPESPRAGSKSWSNSLIREGAAILDGPTDVMDLMK